MSTSDHFASWCCTTVLPEPKGPGTAAVPPLAMGKSVSMMRWPEFMGRAGTNFLVYGRWIRTGQRCTMVRGCSPLSVLTLAITSSTVYSPFLMTQVTAPLTPFGTMILWRIALVSCTVPSTSPGPTSSPGLATGTNSHFFSRLRAGTSVPLVMQSPVRARISGSGR